VDSRDVVVATIVGVHGLGGGVKAEVYTDSGDFFKPGTAVGLRRPGGQRQSLTIRSLSGTHNKHLLFFEKVTDRDQAMDLVGCEVVVARQALPPTADDEYYWHDLIGMRVVDGRCGDIGTIVSIIATGSNDVYVVKGPEGEKLIPALGSVVVAVDLQQATMRVNLPEGL